MHEHGHMTDRTHTETDAPTDDSAPNPEGVSEMEYLYPSTYELIALLLFYGVMHFPARLIRKLKSVIRP